MRALAAGALGALSLLTWRVTELLECDGVLEGVVWRILGLSGTLALGLVLVVPLASRAPKIAILLALLAAAGSVVADVGLRGWWISPASVAAVPLAAVQQLWALVAVLLFVFLPARLVANGPSKGSSRSSSVRIVPAVDALERRGDRGGDCASPRRPWFW